MKRLLQFFLIGYLLCLGTSAFSQSEPSNHVTGLNVSTTSDTELELSWSDAAGPTDPEFYLIVGRTVVGGTFATVADGAEVAADADWTDDNFAAIVIVGTESLSILGLTPGTEYEFRVYSYQRSGGSGGNSNYKTTGAPTESGFTFSLVPGGHSTTFTATLNGDVDIDLAFDAANTIADADGYVIYRRAGSAASLSGLDDGAAPPSTLGGTTTLVYTTDDTETTYSDIGLDGGVTYHYVLVPFNFNGTDDETHSYLTDASEPRANAATNLIISIAPISGGGTNIATDPLGSGTSDQAILGFSITTNGPTTFNALNVDGTTTPVGKFTSPRIFKSADAVYGSDASINSGSVAASQLQFISVGDVLAAGTTNYFIVVNVSASVNGTTPAIEPSFSEAAITFTSPSGTAQTVTVTGTNYTFVDASPPTISTLTPVDGATGVSVLITTFNITFNEAVIYVGDNSDDANRIRIWDDDANAFVETINVIDVNVVGSTVTFITDFAFDSDTNYDIVIGNSVFEDAVANPFPGIAEDDWEFQTEDDPNITSMSDAIVCIDDQLTINGVRFTGTGGSGNTQPFVFINGVQVTPANITAFSSTTITLTVPSGVTTGNVTVQNRDNFLTSNGDPLTVHPQINTGISVTPATNNPAQGENVDITLSTTQDNNYSYALILTAAPAAYTEVPPSTVDTQPGNSGSQTVNTSASADDLDEVGNYNYRVDVSRTGCTTRTLTTTFQLTVAALDVVVSATDISVCTGSQTTLIGAASGGTGFYQFRWTSTPAGYSSNSSSPTVSPTSNIRYNLELEDNAGNIVNDFVDVVVNPLPVADIVPIAGETVVRTNYVLENRDYELAGTPAGGVFTGQGVILKNDGKYYFNPFNAGVNTVGWPIVYTYTDVNGCSDQDTENFKVNTAAITNLGLSYCRNSAPGTALTQQIDLSPNSTFPAGIQFTRLVFYRQLRVSPYTYCIAEVAPTFPYCGGPNPLTATSWNLNVPDIFTGVPFNQPTAYTLDLDMVRNNYGYSTDNYFYILAYGKDAGGVETYWTFQYFDVFDNNPAPAIVGINQNENVCSDTPPIVLSSSEAGYSVTNFSILQGFPNTLTGTDNENFNPGHADLSGPDERLLTLRMDYNDFNNCPNRVIRNFNWVKKPNSPIANDSSFCQFANPSTFKLKARKSGSADNTFWYDDTMVELASGTFIFDVPGVTGLIPVSQDFNVSQSYKGCEGDALEVTVSINPAPNAAITRGPVCEGRDFLLTGPEQSPGVPYSKYDWNFGDGNTASVLANNTYTYNYGSGSALTLHTISLTVTTSLGCTNTSTDGPTSVGQNPIPDFTYNFVCEGDATKFFGSTNIPATHYEWDFDDLTVIPKTLAGNAAPEGGTIQEPVHNFLGGVGEYDVIVTAYTASQCFNSTTKKVNILEYLTHDSATPYDMASVDGGQGFWTKEDVAGNTTWEFAQPTSQIMNEFTSPAWSTSALGNYLPGEYSFLNSPCLNIMDIDRPVLSFNYILNTDENRDGVAFEYSKNGGVTWSPLGGPSSGFNWFNTSGFITGTIGNSTVGLSGNSWEMPDNTAGDTLIQARRALDNLPNLSLAERAKVRFRIAFKTDNVRELDGISFNNLTIASRNRVLLVENFTNEGDASYSDNNTAFKNIPISEAVKIQYHVGAPGSDANYLINTADPSARAAFYGIPLTDQTIPRGYIDGYSNGNFIGAGWVSTQSSQRALKVAPFTLFVETVASTDPSYITVSATITVLEAIPGIRKPVLQIALVEKIVGSNEYVLRKLLPSAIGRKLTTPMTQGTIVNITESVRIENPDVVISQLAVVGFIQDEETREVYQASIDMLPTNLPVVNITGTEDAEYAEKINLYPNPANNELTIQLPTGVTKNTPMWMFDAYGRTVVENSFAPGESNRVINTRELTAGVYIMQISTPDGKTARRKIMVIHR